MKYYIGRLKDNRFVIFRHGPHGLTRATQEIFLTKESAQKWLRNHKLISSH